MEIYTSKYRACTGKKNRLIQNKDIHKKNHRPFNDRMTVHVRKFHSIVSHKYNCTGVQAGVYIRIVKNRNPFLDTMLFPCIHGNREGFSCLFPCKFISDTLQWKSIIFKYNLQKFNIHRNILKIELERTDIIINAYLL